MVLIWLGEIITERGIGNGISIIIMAGIVVTAPQAVAQTLRKISETGEPIVGIMLIIVFLMVIAASILLTQGTRRIPVQYGKRMTGQGVSQATSQFIPMKINAAGVIPIIFASALLMFPSQMLSLFGGGFQADSIVSKLSYWLSPGQPLYVIFYSLLIIFFCYFYTSIKFNPNDIADNLKKYGGFIPGIRPGTNTSDYLMFILNRITLFFFFFLAAIAIVPDFILKLWPDQVAPEMAYMFGGTSLLIIVGVALDTLKQIESQLLMRHYDGFIKGKKIKGR
jgi:preprotein translocase subunit SecY